MIGALVVVYVAEAESMATAYPAARNLCAAVTYNSNRYGGEAWLWGQGVRRVPPGRHLTTPGCLDCLAAGTALFYLGEITFFCFMQTKTPMPMQQSTSKPPTVSEARDARYKLSRVARQWRCVRAGGPC